MRKGLSFLRRVSFGFLQRLLLLRGMSGRKGNKRGMSAVVATVLIILITVARVAIVWAAIIPMIQQGLAFSNLEGQVRIITSGGYTCL